VRVGHDAELGPEGGGSVTADNDELDGWATLTEEEWAKLDDECRASCSRQATHLPAEARRGLHAPWCPTPRTGCVCDVSGVGY